MQKLLNIDYLDEEKQFLADYLGPQFKLIKSSKFKQKVFPYLWRSDNQCGKNFLNPLGKPAECNPYSSEPCCSDLGFCGNSIEHCDCKDCKKAKPLEEQDKYYPMENIFNPHIGKTIIKDMSTSFLLPLDI